MNKEQKIARALEALLPLLTKFEDKRYWVGRQVHFFCYDKRTNPTAGSFGNYHKAFHFADGQLELYQDYKSHQWTAAVTVFSKKVFGELLITKEKLQRWNKICEVANDLEKALNADE